MLRDRRLAFASVMVATTLTATPTPATTISVAAVHRNRMDESLDGLEGDEHRHDEQREAVCDRRQNLGPLHAECVRTRLGPRRQAQRHERSGNRTHVGQHVAGVGQQRQGVREERRHHLESHEGDEQSESDRQVSMIGLHRQW